MDSWFNRQFTFYMFWFLVDIAYFLIELTSTAMFSIAFIEVWDYCKRWVSDPERLELIEKGLGSYSHTWMIG